MDISSKSSPTSNSTSDWWTALPFQLSDVKVRESIRPEGFRFRKHSFDIFGVLEGKKILVTGEAESSELAMTKAVAEFIERCVLLNYARQNLEVKTSNGWAAHSDHCSAELNAMHELVERDAVLKHWYTKTPFYVLNSQLLPEHLKDWVKNELSRSEFPILRILVSHLGLGPSITAILINSSGYGVTGHCSKESMIDSIEGAIEEACRMAHHSVLNTFFNDTVKMKEGSLAKVETGAHGVYYSHQEVFPVWMFGEEVELNYANKVWLQKNASLKENRNSFTFSMIATDPLFVVQCKNDQTIELSWGLEKSESLFERLKGKMGFTQLSVKQLNLLPHIIP